ncbi:MAG: GspE/PulE family protein, partial [Desulfosalsimonas sp.]
MESVKEKSGFDAKMKSAEAYESHGLFKEAASLYREILEGYSDLDKKTRTEIQEKINALNKELEEVEQTAAAGLSSEDVSHIKSGLSIGGSMPEIRDSAMAFKELGLYKEAVAEYKKLVGTDYALENYYTDMLDSLFALYAPSRVLEEIDKIASEKEADDKTKAAMKYELGQALEQRDYKEFAIQCYKSVQNIDPVYPKIKEKIEAVEPGQRFESRYDYLLRNNIVTTDQLRRALSQSKKTRKSVEHVLMEQFKVSKDQIGKSLSAYYNCPFKTYNPNMEAPYELLTNLKKPFLLQDLWVPLHWEIDHIEILLDDPKDLRKLDHAKALFNTNKFTFSVGIKEDIEAIINHFFAEKKAVKDNRDTGPAAAMDFEDLPEIEFEEEEEEEEDLEGYTEASGKVVRLVDQSIITALRRNASDIHVEPSPISKKTKIRYRIDGVCQDFLEIPNNFANAVLSRIKIMAGLDIAERRMPQDGKIKFKRRGLPQFELRVATLPTAGGYEDAVMRILATAGAMK